MMLFRKGMSLLLALTLLFGAFSAVCPVSALADGDTVYTVRLLPGDHGTGTEEEIVYHSNEGTIADDWCCDNYQFYYENGALAFRLDYRYCPFSAEQGWVFDTWSDSSTSC